MSYFKRFTSLLPTMNMISRSLVVYYTSLILLNSGLLPPPRTEEWCFSDLKWTLTRKEINLVYTQVLGSANPLVFMLTYSNRLSWLIISGLLLIYLLVKFEKLFLRAKLSKIPFVKPAQEREMWSYSTHPSICVRIVIFALPPAVHISWLLQGVVCFPCSSLGSLAFP